MKKRLLSILFIILITIIIIMPQVKANGEANNTVIANITDESKTVEQNKSVFVEMSIDNIEKVKSIIGYIASTTDSEQYITVELQSTNQGTWYYFILPSNTVVGQTYIMPMIEVTYEDETKVTGKATGEFKVIEEIYDYSKVIGNITDESKTVEQNKSVFVEMSIDNIEKVKTIIAYIASTTKPDQHIKVELQSTTQGKWYYFIMPSSATVGQTYTMPKIEVIYEDGTKVTGKAIGEFKVIEEIYDYSKVIGKITDESKNVEQNKSVFVEMSIDNIEKVKSIIAYIASTTKPEQYIKVELQSTTQGKWYHFTMPSSAVVGQIYTMPKVEVTYEDGTKITGKMTGEVKIIKNSEQSNSSNNGDNTVAKDKLPNAGKDMLIGTIGLLTVLVTIIAIKNKKYRGI